MEADFNPEETAHIDLPLDSFSSEIQLVADKFVLWFQPVYELETGKVLHNEVLIRWRDNQGNLKSPKELFLILEGTQLLWQLDRIVIEKSIEILSKQANVNLSVNLSREVLEDSFFLSQLKIFLDRYSVEPKRLSFELEELIIQEKFSQSLQLMKGLKEIGCSVILDSCTGTYFSLQQWQILPIDIIKLDRGLISKTQSQANELAQKHQLAIAIIKISKTFNKKCIAKGIDNQALLTSARNLGVQGVQGYLLNSPQNKPSTLISMGLVSTGITSLFILLYIFKSLLGINLDPDRHAWEVIQDFVQPFFENNDNRPSDH